MTFKSLLYLNVANYEQVLFCVVYMPLFGWFRQRHGFEPPCGSHQLPVYLKYSVRLIVARATGNSNTYENVRHSFALDKRMGSHISQKWYEITTGDPEIDRYG